MATIDIYPDAQGVGGQNTFDGRGRSESTSWATARGATNSTSEEIDDATVAVGNDKNGTIYQIDHWIWLFDTSVLGAGATINSATLSPFFNNLAWNQDNMDFHVVEATTVANTAINPSDFGNRGTVDFGSISFTMTSEQYYPVTLNSDGRDNINITGISKFGFRGSHDLDSTTPVLRNVHFFRTADYTSDSTSAPKLHIDYDAGSTFIPKIIMS